jgi:hypothetical protein
MDSFLGFLFHYMSVFVTMTMITNLQSDTMISPALLFLPRITFATWGLLFFPYEF